MRGLLVVIEGPDGSGKRTQTELLAEHLVKEGLKVKWYSYPDYGSPYGRLLAEHLEGRKTRGTKEVFLLFLADMVANAEEVERELETGGVVLMDRYFQSTVAYQSATGFRYEDAKRVEDIFGLREPDIAIYTDIPSETAMRRKKRQKELAGGKADRHETSREIQDKVREVYERMISEGYGAKRWVKIDGTGSREEQHKRIAEVVDAACSAIREKSNK
ncbi:MAG: dTMP kinase [Candidatus Micrarchaeota archaeon]|nr:dTMP kinase [Candidatus Micrarchaeota archaeon]